MPLYKDFSDDKSIIRIWKYDETDDLSVDTLLNEEEKISFEQYHPKRLQELLMIRKMLYEIKSNSRILYLDSQPFLEDNSAHISITHAFPFAAIAISQKKIGIDLEKISTRILQIIDKFVYENERLYIPEHQQEIYYTIIWSIKESLYKLHHAKHWSLKKHYKVHPFSLLDLSEINCEVYDEKVSEKFVAKCFLFDNHCFTVVID